MELVPVWVRFGLSDRSENLGRPEILMKTCFLHIMANESHEYCYGFNFCTIESQCHYLVVQLFFQ